MQPHSVSICVCLTLVSLAIKTHVCKLTNIQYRRCHIDGIDGCPISLSLQCIASAVCCNHGSICYRRQRPNLSFRNRDHFSGPNALNTFRDSRDSRNRLSRMPQAPAVACARRKYDRTHSNALTHKYTVAVTNRNAF